MSINLLALACAGGALGAGTRYAMGVWFLARGLGGFPWATLLINVSGSLLMGVLVGLLEGRGTASPELRVFLATGVLGGYTTFSAFSLEFWQLVERNQMTEAVLYLAGSVVLSIAGLVAGLYLARWLA